MVIEIIYAYSPNSQLRTDKTPPTTNGSIYLPEIKPGGCKYSFIKLSKRLLLPAY